MGKISYVAKRMLGMNYGKMLKTVNEINQKTKKSKLWLFSDMLKCAARYQAGYMDYKVFALYDVPEENRKNYVTRGVNNLLVSKLNQKPFWHSFEQKNEFNTIFSSYVKRAWLDLTQASFEEFDRWLQNHETFIVKPLDATCGTGVEKIKKSDFPEHASLYRHLMQKKCLVEELILQHDEINRLYAGSVNSLRIVTISGDKKSGVVYAFIRIGRGGSIVDNINSGGLAAPIDLEKGRISMPATDKNGEVYTVHPDSGTPIENVSIPFWTESLQLCLDASKVVPEVRYIAWDVAVTPEGPVLIEGNHFPGYDILQLPAHNPSGQGYLPIFREFVSFV